MNPQMYVNEATQRSLELLAARATIMVEPQDGDVACGEHGQGKLAPNAEIVAAVNSVALRTKVLAGKHVVITSGPTQEAIDDVRFLSNRSSGKMGSALARAALLMGARVTVVSGPVKVGYPLNARVDRVQSAMQMLDASLAASKDADIIIGAAAVADYRVANPIAGKMRRSLDSISLELIPNPDIIAALAKAFPEATVVGFAAEPGSDLSTAREKLIRKGIRAIAINDISQPGIGFDSDNNEITLITQDGQAQPSGRKSKLSCALWLLEKLTEALHPNA